jgi:hypothetical protein
MTAFELNAEPLSALFERERGFAFRLLECHHSLRVRYLFKIEHNADIPPVIAFPHLHVVILQKLPPPLLS